MKNRSRIYSICIVMLLCFVKTYSQGEIYLDDRENYAQVVNKYFTINNWAKGKKMLDQGLGKYPKDSDLRMLLGKYYLEHRDYDQARYELLLALEYNKHNTEAKHILVNVEILTERYSSAICYINELLEINPYWRGLWLKKIEVYRLQGNHQEANRLLKRLMQIYPKDYNLKKDYIYRIEEEINKLRNEGRMNEAINLSRQLIEEDPENETIYLELCNNYLKVGNYEEALVCCERGLFNIPGSLLLIDKKASILAAQHKYEELLAFLQLKIKEGHDRTFLERRYSYFLEESARYHRKSEPYMLYSALYDRDPRNEEAFNYVLSTAIASGLYEDALAAVARAKATHGETKELKLKEQMVYEQMGAGSRADRITVELYEQYPDDYDIAYKYVLYRLKHAQDHMNDEAYDKAIEHWEFIEVNGDADMKNAAMLSLYNCYHNLGRYNDAGSVLDRLIAEAPGKSELYVKKADLHGKQGSYAESLREYEQVLRLSSEQDRKRALGGYEELATIYIKDLIEQYRLEEARRLVERWLEIDSSNEMAIRYAINICAQENAHEDVVRYATWGAQTSPYPLYYRLKLAEAHITLRRTQEALDILRPEVERHPHHVSLIGAHSQCSHDHARELIKDTQYEQSIELLDQALRYDPSNKSLRYMKGIAYEKMKKYDSAYYYQAYYDPSPLEEKEFMAKLNYLKGKTYKNRIGFIHMRSRFGDIDQITGLSTLEYIRFEEKDTYASRINYAGRDTGKGIQAQAEWGHIWRHDISSAIYAGVGNKFFPGFSVGGSVFKSFEKDWEAELGIGYKWLPEEKNLYSLTGGISKTWDPWWVNLKVQPMIISTDFYYSISGQARFYIYESRTYIGAMGSFGNAPDVEILNNSLYDAFSAPNTMVGLGVWHTINDRFSAGVLGTWYNYECSNEEFKYRNLYNLYLQLYVNF